MNFCSQIVKITTGTYENNDKLLDLSCLRSGKISATFSNSTSIVSNAKQRIVLFCYDFESSLFRYCAFMLNLTSHFLYTQIDRMMKETEKLRHNCQNNSKQHTSR